MKFICEVKHPSGVCTTIYLHGESEQEAIDTFTKRHPNLEILSSMILLEWEDLPKCKARTGKQIRTHHKARITQVRNNLQSLVEDEKSVLTDEERVQLSRAICKVQHILGKWHVRDMDLQREGVL